MENIDYDLLKINLKKIVSKIFSDYIKEFGTKDIGGFALYSAEDGMSVSINTLNYLENSIKNDPENELDYKFNVEKWNKKIENKDIDDYNIVLQGYYIEMNKRRPLEQRLKHTENIYKLSVEALYELKEEDCFKNMNNEFILLVAASRTDEKLILEYNKKYNSKNAGDEYYQWAFEQNDMSKS